jgi:hypothetical protein
MISLKNNKYISKCTYNDYQIFIEGSSNITIIIKRIYIYIYIYIYILMYIYLYMYMLINM